MGKLFGTDGIRGVANQEPMTAELAIRIGRAVAHKVKREGHQARIIIGKDTRRSCYMLESALMAGICSMGVDALLVGVMPTPGIAFLIDSMRVDAGFVISASHNPYEDNGIKIFSAQGTKLPDNEELEIEDLILSDKLDALLPSAKHMGRAIRIEDARGRYIVFLKSTFPKKFLLEGIKIVLDCANGATYRMAPTIFTELGAEVIPININPNGKNINLQCGALHPGKMAAQVLEQKAHIGLAFDGDGDRLIAIDESGEVITGDQIIAICAKTLKEEGRLAKNMVISTVMSNLGFNIAMKKMGIEQSVTKVGDRYVYEELMKTGAVLGGEDSGHIIFAEFHTTGDGILSALQLLASMKKEEKPLSELARVMQVFPQTLINITVKEKRELSEIPEIVQITKQVEDDLGDRGRVLVRYSGTELLCRVMVEGPTDEKTEQSARQIANVIQEKLG